MYVDDSISDETFEGIPSEDETGEDGEENSMKDIFSSFMDDDSDE